MSNIYLDTEFYEHHKQHKLLGFNIGKPVPTIDLISIGLVDDNGRTYYALNSEHNIDDSWKDEWIRENVWGPIYIERAPFFKQMYSFSLHGMKQCLRMFGRTKKQIADDIVLFFDQSSARGEHTVFHAYYADYDWVVMCQLFGRMINLPNGFPMYCNDLKQDLDTFVREFWLPKSKEYLSRQDVTWDEAMRALKSLPDYPKNDNLHNAVDDAEWNKRLHQFLKQMNNGNNTIK